jgi:hypothetical protein
MGKRGRIEKRIAASDAELAAAEQAHGRAAAAAKWADDDLFFVDRGDVKILLTMRCRGKSCLICNIAAVVKSAGDVSAGISRKRARVAGPPAPANVKASAAAGIAALRT